MKILVAVKSNIWIGVNGISKCGLKIYFAENISLLFSVKAAALDAENKKID